MSQVLNTDRISKLPSFFKTFSIFKGFMSGLQSAMVELLWKVAVNQYRERDRIYIKHQCPVAISTENLSV